MFVIGNICKGLACTFQNVFPCVWSLKSFLYRIVARERIKENVSNIMYQTKKEFNGCHFFAEGHLFLVSFLHSFVS